MNYQPPPDPSDVDWQIERKGRSWKAEETWPRYELTPEKIELIDGKILWSEEARLRLLGLLLENCGAEAAVRMGNPDVWRNAVSLLDDDRTTFQYHIESAYRRWDDFDSQYPIVAIRWYEQLTTPDYHEIESPDRAEGKSRSEILTELGEKQTAKHSYEQGYSTRKTTVKRVQFGSEQGEVQVCRTFEHHRYEKTDERSFRPLPVTYEVERWHDTWVGTPEGWRIQHRVRIEGPVVV